MNIEFGGLNIEMRKRAGPRDNKIVSQIREVVKGYPDAKTLALVLRSSGVSAEEAQYLSATLSYDTHDQEAALLFERMQTAAAKISAWEKDGFIENRDETLSTGDSARFGRRDGSHPEAAYRDGDDRE